MRPQSSLYLSTFCLLLSVLPTFSNGSESNATTEYDTEDKISSQNNTTHPLTTTTEFNSEDTNTSTASSPSADSGTATASNTSTASNMSTASSTSSIILRPMTTAAALDNSGVDVGSVLCLSLFFCFLIVLLICAYRWYARNGRPSLPVIRRTAAESARSTWAAVVGRLRTSSKEEQDEEMDAGTTEAETEKMQVENAEDEDDDDDDASSDYSSIDNGAALVEKDNEEEDRQSSESLDDTTSGEVKDDKTERENDDVTVL